MKLSIITINFNNRNGLIRTIDSIQNQIWRNFEWIIIDGGSSDGSKDVIETIAANSNSNISYWCSEQDKGIYNAMNKGIAKANGEYLCFMNSGDSYYEHTTLEKVFSVGFEEDILYGNWMKVYPDKKEIVVYPQGGNIWDLYCNTICQQAMFVKRDILIRQGFDESFKVRGDAHRWIVASLDGNTFRHIGITVCNFYMDGISCTGKQYPEEDQKIDNLLPSSCLPAIKRMYVYENAHTYKRLTGILKQGGWRSILIRAFLKLL